MICTLLLQWTTSSDFGTYRLCEQRRFRRVCAVSPEPPLLAHTSSESRGTFRQKARSLAPLNGWACAVKICHGVILEDTNLLDRAHNDLECFEKNYTTDSSLKCSTNKWWVPIQIMSFWQIKSLKVRTYELWVYYHRCSFPQAQHHVLITELLKWRWDANCFNTGPIS